MIPLPQRLLLSLLALAAPLAWAAPQPLWEAGAGLAVLSLPDYRGADQRQLRTLPLPYVIYRGPRLKADREGVRTTLFDSERLELNLSALGSLPTDSEDNTARRGMPDLKTIIELGPSLNLRLAGTRASGLNLRLPLRAGFTLERNVRHVGWIFAPNIAWHTRSSSAMPGWNLSASAGPIFQDSRYNSTFYGVTPAQALPDRPAFETRSGYAGSQATFAMSRRFAQHWVGAFLRYDYLGGAVFEDSPLLRSRTALSAGIGLSWVFGQSQTMVESAD
ncbi:MAG: MipA/OmpV family protein [Paucimonas sp.]|jgi:outer membrane protein|nr:MipA/OmpV family protein [Paucimonas sp.]